MHIYTQNVSIFLKLQSLICSSKFQEWCIRSYASITVKNVELSLCSVKHQVMEMYCGLKVYSHILNLSTRYKLIMISFVPQPLYPHGNSTKHPVSRGSVGPRDNLNAVDRRKNFPAARNQALSPWSSSSQTRY
jgi:hypothetical protein